MELKTLANSLGIKNILVTHINHSYYKDDITVIVSDNLLFTLVGKTISFIPLTADGIGKEISRSNYTRILNLVKETLKGESF